MKILFYKTLYICLYCYGWCGVYLYQFFAWSPWGRAYIVTAFKKYLESDWYKERASIFVKRQAFKMYFDNDESWFFKRKITRREKLGIAFTPFSYIRNAQEKVRDMDLMDYV